MTTSEFQRARSAESKRQRAQTLVESARSLAIERGVASVTLTAIADRAGVHHSAMRRYFSSHKDVLLQLAAEGWQRWADAVGDSLRGRVITAVELGPVLARTLADDPLFCDLLASVPLHLEHDVPLERVIEFKQTSRAAIENMVSVIVATSPLSAAEAVDAITAANALGAMLWQVTHPTAQLGTALSRDPNLSFIGVDDFTSTLTRILSASCAGLAIRES